ncbi:hypothetical protein COO60DRAFT_1622041 [Scenedesmus sp. NREL 46B-D3]|nr:hypothetical protein COO60DRAFT_1622041 [Scenedesmus sp. NREL 46B-D3]
MPAGRAAHAHEHAAALGSSRGPGSDEEDWQEVAEEGGRPGGCAAGPAAARHPGGPSSREADAAEGGPCMTWQQQQLLADEQAPPAGPAAHSAERHRERSPADSGRSAAGAAQPSQRLRAAAHAARRRPDDRDAAAEPGGQAEFLQQLAAGSRPQTGQQEEWAGAADGGSGPAPAACVPATQVAAKEAAAAAALAAVQGLKPFCTLALPRAAKAPLARKGSSPTAALHTLHSPHSLNSPKVTVVHKGGQHAGSGSAHVQMPSLEETQAAVMAALGAGPVVPSRSSSVNSSSYKEQVPQQDSSSFWKAGSSSSHDRHDGSSAARCDSRERDSRDRDAELFRDGSGGSGQREQGPCDAAAGSGPRRGGSSLFSNVIGQLRKQATTRSDTGGDAEAYSTTADALEPEQSPKAALRVHTASYAAAVAHDAAASPPSSYLAAAAGSSSSNRRSGSAADMVLAAIQTTRQRTHAKMATRTRQNADDSRSGKADAAWREADNTHSTWDAYGADE